MSVEIPVQRNHWFFDLVPCFSAWGFVRPDDQTVRHILECVVWGLDLAILVLEVEVVVHVVVVLRVVASTSVSA